jgi:hypothetical protein
MREAIDHFFVYNATNVKNTARMTGQLLEYVDLARAAADAEAFLLALDQLLTVASTKFSEAAAKNKRDRTRGKGRICDLLGLLWSTGCIAWPTTAEVLGRTNVAGLEIWSANRSRSLLANVIEPFQTLNGAASSRTRRNTTIPFRHRILLELLLSTIGVEEIGDLSPDVVGTRLVESEKRGHASGVAQFLGDLIRAQYACGSAITAHDYFDGSSKGDRSDITFKWAALHDASVEEWRSLAEEFLRNKKHGHAGARSALNQFFEMLLADVTIPRKPTDLLRSSYDASQLSPMFESASTNTGAAKRQRLSAFFDFVLNTMCVEEGDDGLPYRLPGFRNPISPHGSRISRAETQRDAPPTRYVRMMLEILEENDYEWPRTVESDYFNWRDPETGEWQRVWSPVRADAMRCKLLLPLRTFQVRVLNSGEADKEKYDAHVGKWVRNTHALAAVSSSQFERGVLKRVWDQKKSQHFIGLFINTNKTRDLYVDARDRGYTIPYQHDEVISILANLRDWQERYNPVDALVAWSDIKETVIAKGYHKDVLIERGSETFLFRDPASRRPSQPVTQGRLQQFWLRLCEELERRLRKLGETGPDGLPITLVKRNSSGNVTSCVYDLHGLRVALLTAWGEHGVPIDVLMKVAGHCTAIMTIYYLKYSISHVTEILNAAQLERLRCEQTDWEKHIRSRDLEQLESLVASNDPCTLSLLAAGTGASWIRSDIGVCPVGGSRCSEGGELVSAKGETARYAPVPGGARNCVRCRFFITGPAFLIGLHSHFSATTLRLQTASRKYAEAERKLLEVDAERKRSEISGEVFLETKKWQIVSAAHDQFLKELDDVILTWLAMNRLIEDCLAILRSKRSSNSDSRFALVTNGPLSDLELVLELDEKGEREFELLDQICQSAEWFESVDAGIANLKRMRRFDAFLTRNGQQAVFCDMDEQDALRAGNELAKLMYSHFRRDDVNALMAGTKTLAAMGIDAQSRVINAARQIRLKAGRSRALTKPYEGNG